MSPGQGRQGAPWRLRLWLLGAAFQHLLSPLRKVVRRASLSDRTNLYRKEYEGEAILWQQRSAAEEQRTSAYNGDIREARTDQENKDPVSGLVPCPRASHCLGRRMAPRTPAPGLASSCQRLQREVRWAGP